VHWSTQSKVEIDDDDYYKVFFYTKNCPPMIWLANISTVYPDLQFNHEWIVYGMAGGVIDACNGELQFSDRNPDDIEI